MYLEVLSKLDCYVCTMQLNRLKGFITNLRDISSAIVPPCCLSAASESQTGHGEEAVCGQPGELQETVRQTSVEGKIPP